MLTEVVGLNGSLVERDHEIVTRLVQLLDRLRGWARHHTHFVVVLRGGEGREERRD